MPSSTSDRRPHRRTVPEVPERVRMPLLDLITQQSLDEDYSVAAAARAAGAPRPPVHRPRRTAAVVLVVFGLMVTTAALQTQANQPAEDQSRASLIERVNTQKRTLGRQQADQARLTARNATSQRALIDLTDTAQALSARSARIEAQAGFAPVRGPGVRVTVTQVPDADQNQQVRDTDLAQLANGLWAAGAEAISINGQRLTAMSAIRTSGPAIYVDQNGIVSPYVVQAIGDPRTLEARFYDTTTGLDFSTAAQQAGFDVDVENVDEMTLPAAPAKLRTLHAATSAAGSPAQHDDPREEPGS